MTELHRITD